MRKLILIALLFTSAKLFAQSPYTDPIGTTPVTTMSWSKNSQGMWAYRGVTLRYWLFADSLMVKRMIAAAGTGVTSFNGRTGVVVPLIGDYSSFFFPIPTGTTAQYLRGNGTLATFPTGLPPTGPAGGDLIGPYPDPTVNTINSITKSFYDPTSSIQTQLNGMLHLATPTQSIIQKPDFQAGLSIVNNSTLGIGSGSNVQFIGNSYVWEMDTPDVSGNMLLWMHGTGTARFNFLNTAAGDITDTNGKYFTKSIGTSSQVLLGDGTLGTYSAPGSFVNNSGTLQTNAQYNVAKATITGTTPAAVSTSSGTNAPTSFVFTPPLGGSTSNSGSFANGGNASDLSITMGKGGSTTGTPSTGVGGNGGNIYLLAGDAGDPAGTTKIAGAAGEVILQGGLSSTNNGASAGNTSIKGGNGYTAANTSGGNVYLVAGQGHGTGLDGSIYSNVSAGGTVRGNMVIAATIDDRLHRLQVTGSAKFTDTVISPRFYITGTGDVATLINKKLDTSVYNKSSVNIYKYGVLGDSTNSAARINAVIQFAATNKTGTVIIPRGTYLLERSISVPSHIHLQIDRNAKFILNSGANSYLIQQSDIVNGNEDIWIDGGYFNGNGINQTTNITSLGNLATDYYGFGFMFHKVNGLRIEHVEIDSTRTFAILAGGNRATIRDLKVMQRYSTSTYNGDGVKFIGSNVYFSDAVLATNDDGWSITPGDNCLGYIPNQGNATNFNIDNINYVAIDTSASKKLDPNNYSARAGRILTVRGDTLTRINITNLNGKVHYGVLNFSTAYPTLTAGGGMYDINISNVNVKVMDNAPFIGLKGSFRFERGYAYNVNFNNITCATDYNIPMFFSTLFNVNNVNVSNTIFKTKPGLVTQMWQDSLSNTQRLNITNAYVGDSTLATSGVLLYKKQGNGTWSNSTVFKASNVQINDAGATVTSNSAGTNAKISLNGISFNVDTAQLFPIAGDVVKNSTKGIGNYYNSKWNWNNNYQQLTGTNTNNSAITFSKNQIFSKYVSMGGSYSNTSGWGTINNGGTTTTRPVIIFADNTNAAAGAYLGLAIGTNDLVTGTVVNDWVSRIPGTKWWWGNNSTAEMSLSSAGVLNLPQLGISGLVGTDASHNISIITSLPSATSLVSPLLTGAGAGTTTLIYGNSVTTGGNYTFPATSTSQTVATLALSQTFTNKTLTSPIINVTSDATGDIYYRNSGGLFTRLPIGSTGQWLSISGGIPAWSSTQSLIIGTPTVVAGTGAGTSPTVSVTSNGRGLQLTVTTGTLPTGTNATIATITLANALSYTPYPTFSSASALTSLLNGASMIYMTSTGTANVTITSGTTALTASTTYVWNIAL